VKNFIVTIPQNSGLRRRHSAPSRIGARPRPPKTFRTPDAAGPVALLCLREAGMSQSDLSEPRLPKGLAPERLLAAVNVAARHKTTPEQAALKEGWIGEADYYNRLSAWLDMPLLAAPLVIGPGADFPHSILSGLAPGSRIWPNCAPTVLRLRRNLRWLPRRCCASLL
jgi:hypothetical protein